MKRLWASELLGQSGISHALLRARRSTFTPWLTVLTYHRIAEQPTDELFEQGLATSKEAFERQLALVVRWFDLVGIDDVVAHLRGRPLPPSPLLITFDDGYRDNFDVALPLLERHGARATFFVATSYVAERRLFWWDRINYLVKRTPRDRLEMTYPQRMELKLPAEVSSRQEQVDALLAIVKQRAGLDLARFLEDLERATDVRLDRAEERLLADRHLMTWDNVRALRSRGMDVQSHTHTHRVIQTLDEQALLNEMLVSRRVLEDVLGERVRALSYPVGRAPVSRTWMQDLLERSGYDLAFSNRGGVNLRWRIDGWDVRRLSLEHAIGEAHAQAILALPALAY